MHNVIKGLSECILLAWACNIKYTVNFDGLAPLTFTGILSALYQTYKGR